jgi:hypothetical protein
VTASLVSDVAVNVLVVIAVLSFIGAQIAQWRATKNSDIRIQELKDSLRAAEERIKDLESKNFELMQKLLKMNGH